MTNEEKLEAFRMRLEGAPLDEIGERFGVSRQRVAQILPKVSEQGRRRPDPRACIYHNIADWMEANRCGYARLAKLCGISTMTAYRALTGANNPSKDVIDDILAITGLTYEEAFSK